MAETLDDSKTFTVMLSAGKFRIVNYSFPASREQGQEVDGTVSVENIGSAVAELRVKLIDVATGSIIDKEPDLYYKNVNPGETVTLNLGTSWGLGAMPAHDWNLKVEAWRQI